MFLYDCLNHFGHAGGFHAVMDVLGRRPDPLPFSCVHMLARCVFDMHSCLTRAVATAVVTRLRSLVFDAVLANDDVSLAEVPEDVFASFCRVMEVLLRDADVSAHRLPLPAVGASELPGPGFLCCWVLRRC